MTYQEMIDRLALLRAKRFNQNATRGNSGDREAVESVVLDLMNEINAHLVIGLQDMPIRTYDHRHDRNLKREQVYWANTWITESGEKLLFNFPAYVIKDSPAVRYTVYREIYPPESYWSK